MELLNAIVTVGALVSLFLFAVSKFTKQVEQLEGKWLEKTLASFAGSPTRGILFGALASALIQSGTATLVATQSLVNAGLLSLTASLAIVLGVNLGGVVTTQLLAFNITHIAAYVVVVGFIISRLHPRGQSFGKLIYYFGLMFLALSLISVYLSPLEYDPTALAFFSHIASLPVALLVGLAATALFQSGLVITSLVLVLVGQGVLGFVPALGVVLGSSVGSGVTVLLSSLVMNRDAKRMAIANSLFNIIGMVVILACFTPLTRIIQALGGGAVQQVVNASIVFNIVLVLVVAPFLKPLGRLVTRLVK